MPWNYFFWVFLDTLCKAELVGHKPSPWDGHYVGHKRWDLLWGIVKNDWKWQRNYLSQHSKCLTLVHWLRFQRKPWLRKVEQKVLEQNILVRDFVQTTTERGVIWVNCPQCRRESILKWEKKWKSMWQSVGTCAHANIFNILCWWNCRKLYSKIDQINWILLCFKFLVFV